MTPSVESEASYRDERTDGRTYVNAVARRWWVVVIVLALCVGAAIAYTALASPSYEATTTLVYTPEAATSVGLATPDSQASDRILSAQSRLVTTPTVLLRASAKLSGSLSTTELRDALTVTAQPANSLLLIRASASSARRSVEIADVVADTFLAVRTRDARERISAARAALMRTAGAGGTPSAEPTATPTDGAKGTAAAPTATPKPLSKDLQAQLATIDAARAVAGSDLSVAERATTPDSASSPKAPIDIAIGLVAGLFLGVMLALAIDALAGDRRGRAADA